MQQALSGGKSFYKMNVAGIFITDLPQYDSKYSVSSLFNARKFFA